MKGLLVDFGGVLTTNVFESFREFCREEGLDADAFLELMREDEDARADLRAVETGKLDEQEFGRRLALRLGLEEDDGLIDRLFARIQPDGRMVAAVKQARAAGVKTGLLSNSMGAGRYDRDSFPQLFDAVVISGEVGLHKPQPEIFELAAERVGLPPEECVFVDDLRENCAGAEEVGMTAVLHRGADSTLPELERLLQVKLG